MGIIQPSQYATAGTGREPTSKQHEVLLCSISHDRVLTGSNTYSSVQEICISCDDKEKAIRKPGEYWLTSTTMTTEQVSVAVTQYTCM
jgi:hypothetical protein